MELMVRTSPRTERIDVLCRAFDGALSPAQLDNLRYHLGAKSRICCGELAWHFIHKPTGAAAIEVLANTRKPQILRELCPISGRLIETVDAIWKTTFVSLVRSGECILADIRSNTKAPLSDYMRAVEESTESDIRKAFSIVTR